MKARIKNQLIKNIYFGRDDTEISEHRESRVLFFDYDGTLVASYTKSEFMTAPALPDAPDHTADNLTFARWNWSLFDIYEYSRVSSNDIVIGASYTPTDARTHIYCETVETNLERFLVMTLTDDATVSWGDTGTSNVSAGDSVSVSHTYLSAGEYDITIETTGTVIFETYIAGTDVRNGSSVYKNIIFGPNVTLGEYTLAYCRRLKKVVMPCDADGHSMQTRIEQYTFYYCRGLEFIALPSGVTTLYSHSFDHVDSAIAISLPASVTYMGPYTFFHDKSLKYFTIPPRLTEFRTQQNLQSVILPEKLDTTMCPLTNLPLQCFYADYGLKEFIMNNRVTTVGNYLFRYCRGLESVKLSNNLTSLSTYMFANCTALAEIDIPASVTSIKTYCFTGCAALRKIYCRPVSPPELASTNAIPAYDNVVIYVPAASLSAYQSASNWSSFSSKIFAYNF